MKQIVPNPPSEEKTPLSIREKKEMKRISLFRRGHAGGKGREGGVARVSRLPSGSRTCASVE
jgi:hypothetical protein